MKKTILVNVNQFVSWSVLWAQSTMQGLTSGKTDHTEHSKFWLTQAIPASCQSNKTKQNRKKDKKKKKKKMRQLVL